MVYHQRMPTLGRRSSMTRIPFIRSRSAGAGRISACQRSLSGFWLVVYALITLGIPVADARAEHGAPVVAHWEDGTDSNCPARHDASTCQLFQSVASRGRLPASAAVLPPVERDVVHRTSAWDARVTRAPELAGLGSRAPPVA